MHGDICVRKAAERFGLVVMVFLVMGLSLLLQQALCPSDTLSYYWDAGDRNAECMGERVMLTTVATLQVQVMGCCGGSLLTPVVSFAAVDPSLLTPGVSFAAVDPILFTPGVSFAAVGPILFTPGVSFAAVDPSLLTPGVSFAAVDPSLLTPGVSFAAVDPSLLTPGVSFAAVDPSLLTPGVSFAAVDPSLLTPVVSFAAVDPSLLTLFVPGRSCPSRGPQNWTPLLSPCRLPANWTWVRPVLFIYTVVTAVIERIYCTVFVPLCNNFTELDCHWRGT